MSKVRMIDTDLLVLNLYGGPGTGKSTGMSYIFAMLKMLGIRAETCHEFAKDLTWEQRDYTKRDQVYIFGKQQKKLNIIRGKVEIAITDSPLLFSIIYGRDVTPPSFKNLVVDTYRSYTNIDYFLNRVKPYDGVGRDQDEAQAKMIDTDIFETCLAMTQEAHLEATGDFDGYQSIVTQIVQMLRPELLQFWVSAAVKMTTAWIEMQEEIKAFEIARNR